MGEMEGEVSRVKEFGKLETALLPVRTEVAINFVEGGEFFCVAGSSFVQVGGEVDDAGEGG